MSELRKLWIPGPAGRLEAALRVACPGRAAAVVAHPHPLHGGTLHNPVVFHAERELFRAGFTTLRFNFRGVGESQGSHDEGRGEVEDLGAAASWLRGVALGLPLFLVGYSFGSICSLRHAVGDPSVHAVIGIGVPVGMEALDEVERLARPLAVVQGGRDEFGGPEAVARWLRRARPRGKLYVVPESSHLFPERAREAAAKVVQAAGWILDEMPVGDQD
jgi:alpha/beta superfamily hydrolase